jgi:hypothetical protein
MRPRTNRRTFDNGFRKRHPHWKTALSLCAIEPLKELDTVTAKVLIWEVTQPRAWKVDSSTLSAVHVQRNNLSDHRFLGAVR